MTIENRNAIASSWSVVVVSDLLILIDRDADPIAAQELAGGNHKVAQTQGPGGPSRLARLLLVKDEVLIE